MSLLVWGGVACAGDSQGTSSQLVAAAGVLSRSSLGRVHPP